jgi:peptidyl-prolyl cis-trans isomerase D
MFNVLREYAQSWWFKAILLSIVFSFVGTIFWIWGRGRSEAPSRIIAEIDGQDISIREYQDVYNNLYKFYSNIYRDNFSPELIESLNLRQMALNQLIQRKLILAQAEILGLKVSDKEVIDWIKRMPAFQKDKVFDPQIYLKVLRSQGINSSKFEEGQREALILKKVEDLIKDSVKVSEIELRQAYEREKQEIQVEYILLKPDIFMDKIDLSEEEIKNYYDKAKGSFRRPTTIKVEYLLFRPEDYLAEVKISEDEIKDYYIENKAEYWSPKEIKARHILLRLPPTPKPEEEEKVKQKAEDLIKKINQGEDFAELAKKYSQDPATAKEGGDLGYFQLGEMAAPFEEAAFSLKKGEISPPVKSPFGYHIIKVEDIQEAHTIPLDKVKKDIEQKLAKEKARRLARIKAGQFLKSFAASSQTFAQQAEKYHLKVKTTDFFSRDQILPEITSSAKFVQTAFATEVDKLSTPLRTNEGYYILKVINRKESYIPPLEEVKEEIKKELLQKKSREEAAKQLEKMKIEARNKVSFDKLAARFDLKVEKTDFFSRNKDLAPVLSDAPFIKAAFSITKIGEVEGVETPEGYYLLKILKRKEIKNEDYEKEKEDFKKQYLQFKKQKIYSAWLENLRRQTKIKITSSQF